MMPRVISDRLSLAEGFTDERRWSRGRPPPSIREHSSEQTATRAAVVYDVADYLDSKTLSASDRKAIASAVRRPDAVSRDCVLQIAAPHYRAEIADLVPRLRASASAEARAYGTIAARYATAAPAELRILARNCRELAPLQ